MCHFIENVRSLKHDFRTANIPIFTAYVFFWIVTNNTIFDYPSS